MKEMLKNLLPARFRPDVTIVPVVRLIGVIGQVGPMRAGLTLASVAPSLEKAFGFKQAPAVAIVISSPGGSPVQSRLIYKRIRDLAAEKNKHVHVFVEDVAASGGYMLAVAGDEIVADPSSIVGSIGVISAGFGFDRLIDKIGVDRRVHTAGDRKLMLDPFQPEKAEDVKRLKAIQKDVHAVFAHLVKERRGAALAGSDKQLFSGEFWAGGKALELGLVDRLGDLRSVLRERYGEKVRPVVIQPRGAGIMGLLRRVPRAGADPLASLPENLIAAIEERGLWSRYGL
ncbi:MAG: S49 family peptidase [Flavobacteriaceae bacterium]